LRVIRKESLEEFLSLYGIFIEKDNMSLLLTEMYPPLPHNFQDKKVIKVNGGTPFQKQNWKKGNNIIEFENRKLLILVLQDFNWSRINYEPFISQNYFIFQCIEFKNINMLHIPDKIKNVVIDLRFNFGGSLKEMDLFYENFTKTLIEKKIDKLYILISNATCSSAEIFVDKLGERENTYIIGTKTFGKKYVYRLFKDDKVLVYVPEYSISTNIKIIKNVKFYFFYEFYYLNQKKEYIPPDMWKVGDIDS